MPIVKACHICKEYIIIVETFRAQMREKEFEKAHKGHPVGTVNLSEVAAYNNVNHRFDKQMELEQDQEM